MNNNVEYLITELAKAEMWRVGCEKLFGKEIDTVDELPAEIIRIGRERMFNEYFLSEPCGICETYEEYCANRELSYRSKLFTKETLFKVFEKELRAEYETFKSSKAD